MKANVQQLLKRPAIRYMLIGGSVYVFEIAVILLAQHQGESAVLAVGLSYILGTMVSFGLQKMVTFGDKRMQHKILIPQAMAVTVLVLFNFGFTLAIATLLTHSLPTIVIRTLALLVTTLWNFYLYKTRIFKRSDEGQVLVG